MKKSQSEKRNFTHPISSASQTITRTPVIQQGFNKILKRGNERKSSTNNKTNVITKIAYFYPSDVLFVNATVQGDSDKDATF